MVAKKPSPADVIMTPVSGSSAIKAIGHHVSSGTLFIEWHSGHTSAHDDWTEGKHAAFAAAESKGKHYHAHIKSAHPGRAA